MIRQETFDFSGRSLTKTWSDAGMLIRQDETGTLYTEATDPTDMGRTYTETDMPIDDDDVTDTEALRIITGGTVNEEE